MNDAVGNELRVGDLVAMQLKTPIIYGRIVDLREGGLVIGVNNSGSQITPCMIVVMCRMPQEFDPRLPAMSILALRDPTPPEVIEAKMSEEAKPN